MVRYEDRPRTDVNIEIAAAPATVWPLVIDVDLPARFSDEFQGGRWLDPPAAGARFAGQNKRSAWDWQTVCTTIEFDPPLAFAYAVEDVDNPAATWGYALEASEHGTRLTMWAEMGPGPSGVLGAIERSPDREAEIIAARLDEWRQNMRRTLRGIKDLAEANARI